MGGPRGLAVLGLLLACGCNARVVEEHHYEPTAWGTGLSGQALRVRVTGQGSECTLGQLSQSRAVTDAVGTMVDQQVHAELAAREAALAARSGSASTAAREVDLAMADLQRKGGVATEADTLRLLNIVGAGLGAPRPFTTVAEARAFLDRHPAP